MTIHAQAEHIVAASIKAGFRAETTATRRAMRAMVQAKTNLREARLVEPGYVGPLTVEAACDLKVALTTLDAISQRIASWGGLL